MTTHLELAYNCELVSACSVHKYPPRVGATEFKESSAQISSAYTWIRVART